jgi:sterol 3beta-glucosyltransferase
MKLIIVTLGTRGDVQPYVALGRGLQEAGYQVQIAADPSFESLIREAGLGFARMEISPLQALQEDVRQLAGNPLALSRWMERNFRPVARQFFADLKNACQGSDGMLFSSLAFAATHVAQALKIPCLAAYLQPVTPTRAFSNPGMGAFPAWLPFRGQLNRLSFRLSNQAFFRMIKPTIDECRKEVLGLPPVPWRTYATLDMGKTPILYGYSPHVLPKPPDWGDWLHVTGYWFLEEMGDWQPPAELLEFLEGGPPPVSIGFGSMIDREAEEVTRLVIEALGKAGQRAVLLGRWSQLGTAGLPESVYAVDYAPHEWLFPRMGAVVHHGGMGTTAAGLRAGKPSVVVPFFADQPFWGRRVYELGVGPEPILRKKLTVERLASAIRIVVNDDGMRRRAAVLGEVIRAEDGVGNAVQIIHTWLSEQ